MIEFKEKRVVKFHDFQKRNENHGPDLVPAIDIGITVKGPASDLAMIHPDLPASLFRSGEQERAEGQAELDMPIDDLSRVRVPSLKTPLKFEHEQAGMLLHIEYGLSGEKSDIVLALVKLHKVEVKEKHEGGFCVWTAMLSCSNEINEHIIGKVAMLEGYEITIQLTAPEVEAEQKELTAEDVFGPQDPPEPPLTAGDVFANESKPATKAQKAAHARGAKKSPLARKVAAASRKSKARA